MKHPATRRPNIIGHSYDPATRTLTVDFHSGRTYAYTGVPREKAKEFANATSQGGYLHKHIIPHHSGTEITKPRPGGLPT